MIQNALFRQCLADVPEDQKAEFELSFGIAERISEVLKSKNLTQKDFAQKLHKRESEISKWMTGRHNFTMQTIAKIETALGCKLINIAKWYLQTKGKENLSSPCFFCLCWLPKHPVGKIDCLDFLVEAYLDFVFFLLARHRLSKLISALASFVSWHTPPSRSRCHDPVFPSPQRCQLPPWWRGWLLNGGYCGRWCASLSLPPSSSARRVPLSLLKLPNRSLSY